VLFFFLPRWSMRRHIEVSGRSSGQSAPITWLAVGLVLVTAVLVAITAQCTDSGLLLAVAFVLGAIISPPDEIAIVVVPNGSGFPAIS